MFGFFLAVHILISVGLVLVVLLQSGRGGGLAGAFGGGGGTQTFFGGRGAATFLSKATSWLAVAFMIMSILLAVLSSRESGGGEGLLQQRARQRASQVQLPASTTSLNPATALDSLSPTQPAGAAIGEAPSAGDTAAAGAPGANDTPPDDPGQ